MTHFLLSEVIRRKSLWQDFFDRKTKTFSNSDRAFVRLLLMSTLRNLGQIDNILGRFVRRKPNPKIEDILRIALAQILYLKTAHHAAVSTSVDLTKKLDMPKMSGFVNSVLRSIIRKEKSIISDNYNPLINTPKWLSDFLLSDYGYDEAIKIAKSHLKEPSLDLTFIDEKFIDSFIAKNGGYVLPTGSVRIKNQGLIKELYGYDKGFWWIQDAASTIPARILNDILPTSSKVLDACAAPGGKTFQLLANGFDVTSVDISRNRVKILEDNLTRLNLSSNILVHDFLRYPKNNIYEAVLIDAPCSATGTIRRHPEIGYIKSEKQILSLITLQKEMIIKGSSLVKRGGFVMYSNCSLLKKEGEYLINEIIESTDLSIVPIETKNKNLKIDSNWASKNGGLRILPSYWEDLGGIDGFYIALLRKG